jgi:predicted permease
MMPTRTSWRNQIDVDGYPTRPGEDVTVAMTHVGPDFFRTMGIRVERGREFGSSDTAAAQRVAIVNRAMADKYWDGRNAIGGRIRAFDQWITVVGVTANTVDRDLREPAAPFAFLAFDQWLAGNGSIATDPAHLFVRARSDAQAVIPLIREQLRAIDPELPVYDIVPFDERVAALVMPQRMGVTLFGSFSVLALALAAVGIYGVSSYVAALRTREIGIRMALGSDRRAVIALMIRQSVRPIAVGLFAGAALALWAGPVAAAFLYDVGPHDPFTLAAGATLLFVLALLAAYVPARRAARVDPVHALRVE